MTILQENGDFDDPNWDDIECVLRKFIFINIYQIFKTVSFQQQQLNALIAQQQVRRQGRP